MRRDPASHQPCHGLGPRSARELTDGFRQLRHETARSRQSGPEAYNSIPNPYITFMYQAVTHKLRSFI